MKLIRWAIENTNKNIVIITKTIDQADLILKEIKLNIFHESIHSFAPAGTDEIKFDNGTRILIAPEHSSVSRFRGMTINVLLFCDNMGINTINVIKRHLLPQMRYYESIIGELKT